MSLEGALVEIPFQMLVLGALSLCVGWGIRGNFGHEYGAAIPGALAAMVVVLASGRPDWWARVHYVAMFGALGWAFGGSMSYMQVVAYTHSGRPSSSLYGFANLFVIGFLWAAPGGAGTALPLFVSGGDLAVLIVPIAAVIGGWALQAVVVDWVFQPRSARRHESPLYWYDTDWLAAAVAIVAAIIVIACRGGIDLGTALVLHLAVGWFAGFLLLVNVLRLRMTPPRGDNWAGCVGLVGGLLVFCWRYDFIGIAFATVATGLCGGLAFALGQMIKLLWIRTGWQTNWHSVMEQTQGLLFGVGLSLGIGALGIGTPRLPDSAPPPWTSAFALVFVLVGVTYLNHRKNASTWVEHVDALPERPYGLPVAGWLRRSRGWFELFYGLLAAALLYLVIRHRQQPLSLLPSDALGQGQLLYLVFLWWVVGFNFSRAIVAFAPQRLVTEGVIALNAVLCTVLVICVDPGAGSSAPGGIDISPWFGRVLWWGIPVAVATTLGYWGLTHALYGRRHISHAGLCIRFGPDATTRQHPRPGKDHP